MPYPPIIDEVTWAAVQRLRQQNKRLRAKKGVSLDFPLRGMMWCGTCGNRYHPRRDRQYRRRKGSDGQIERFQTDIWRRRYECYGAVFKTSDAHDGVLALRKLKTPCGRK